MRLNLLLVAHLLLILSGIVIICPPTAESDEISLDNGVFLKGTVTGLEGGLLSIKSDYAETIKLKAAKIIGIRTVNQLEIHMKNGEILKGRISSGNGGDFTVETIPGGGMVVFDLQNVETINSVPVTRWKGTLAVAGNLQTGNTVRSNVSTAIDIVRKSEIDRLSVRLLYTIGKENGAMSARSVYGTLKYDYFFSRRFYSYLGLELLNDVFKDIQLRTVFGPGIGYQVLNDPQKELGVEAGISYFIENLKKGADENWFTGRIAANYRQNVTETITFANSFILYPGFKRLNDFKLRNEASFSTALGSGWALKLSNILDYDNAPPPSTDTTDSSFLLGLQYSI